MYFNNSRIDAVLFDMDGLLVDTEPFWEQAEIKAFQECLGMPLTVAECKETMGMRITECIEHWQTRRPHYFQAGDVERVRAHIMAAMEDLIRTQARPLPGVENFMAFVQEQGLPSAIVSSSDYRLIEAVVESQGWTDRFALLQSAQEEEFGKPHPAVWITAARKLRVEPRHCLTLEDSPSGVISAKAARMHCIAVPYAAMRGHAAYGIADLELENLSQLDPNFFIKSD